MPSGPIGFSMIGERSSGERAIKFFDFLIALLVCSQVMLIRGLLDFFLILRKVGWFGGGGRVGGTASCLLALLGLILVAIIELDALDGFIRQKLC